MKRSKIAVLALTLCAALLVSACSGTGAGRDETASAAASTVPEAEPWQQAAEMLEAVPSWYPLTEDFLSWCEQQHPGLCEGLTAQGAEAYTDDLFWTLCDTTLETLHTLYTYQNGDLPENIHLTEAEAPVTLAFGGDVNFADDWYNMVRYHQNGGGEFIGPQLLSEMQAADLLLLNNEFCFSDRGSPLPGKMYTFRANPANAQMWHQIGVDLVGLANNHVYDFGEDAFNDTLDTLTAAGIPYVGAGRNISEAQKAQYFIAGGMKIAYVATSRAEKYICTPEAGPDSPGILRTYEPELTLEAIREAKANSDYVVVYVHWGTEGSQVLEEAQVELATLYAEAGADLIVGAHTHILQGAGWREEVPVLYSMGNFWFNMETEDTALAKVTLSGPRTEDAQVQMLPAIQSGGRTELASPQDAARILQSLNRVMESGSFDEQGILHKNEA